MTTEIRTPGTPPDWVNGLMGTMLRAPLIQRLLGKTFALITVTGAKSGRRYTTPIQYLSHDGEVVVLSQRTRTWWKNIRTRPDVEMRLAGETVHGHGRIAPDEEARSVLTACLADQPRVAKFYGLEVDDSGGLDPGALDRLLERVAVIIVTPHPIDVDLEPADVVIQGF